jgi:hypothetical protein
MGKKVYITVYENENFVTSCLCDADKKTLYECVGDKIRDYLVKAYSSAVWTDTRFSKDGVMLNPNKPLTVEDSGEYSMSVYYKKS